MMQITRRERLLAAGVTVVIGTWALYALAIRPATNRIRTLQRVIPEKQAELQDLQAKNGEYVTLRDDFAQARTKLASQEPDFELLPFLETTIERHKLTGHVTKMEPDTLQPQPDCFQVVVTIELHDVSLKQLVDFLSDVETSKSIVRVGSLHIRTNPKSDVLLDSTVGICSSKLSPPALAVHTAQ